MIKRDGQREQLAMAKTDMVALSYVHHNAILATLGASVENCTILTTDLNLS